MTRCCSVWLLLSLVFAANCGFVESARAQENRAASGGEAREAARRRVLESDRWRQTRRGFDEWLSIQRLYSPSEVATMRKEFEARVDRMSPAELQDTLDNMEAKLEVLNSPEAEEARRWVGQFLSTARNAEEQLRAKRPNLVGMTASQIRLELQAFNDRRAGRQQSQATFSQARNQQVESARDVQASRQQAGAQAGNRTAATIGGRPAGETPAQRGEFLPGQSNPPYNRTPHYTVGPWGNPIRWDPLAGFW